MTITSLNSSGSPPTSSVHPCGLPGKGELLRLTLPQIGLMLCHLIMSMTDIWAAGRLGASVQASVGVVAQIFAMLMLLTSLIANGCMATVSLSLGAGLHRRADRYAGLIIMLSGSAGTAVAALALLFSPLIFRFMSISEELRPALSTFFTAYCCQLPFYYALIMMNSTSVRTKRLCSLYSRSASWLWSTWRAIWGSVSVISGCLPSVWRE